MSKRAEEAASIAAYGWQSDKEGNMTLEMFPEAFKRGFIKGYEQAENDILDKAIGWLKIHADNYILNLTESFPDAPFKAKIGGKCWDDLIKAMEEE